MNRTIEAMSRRIADLESLILATQIRERSNLPPSDSLGPQLPHVSPDEKPLISPYSGTRTTPPGRMSVDDSPEDDAPSPLGGDHSLIDVNMKTHGVEYYGGSSSVAILDRLYKRAQRHRAPSASHKPSVVNLLHNTDFHEVSPAAAHNSPEGILHHSEPVSSRLIEAGLVNAFFDTLHYMHPVVDKNVFMEGCGKGAIDAENDFAALYYACLALAAITSPEKDPKLTGFSPIQWANMYVDHAKKCIHFTSND